MQLSEQIYNRVIRQPLKTVTHSITNKSQIQRICQRIDLDITDNQSFKKYQRQFLHLLSVLENSKELKQNCWSLKNGSRSLEENANHLFSVKAINDFDIQQKVVKILQDVKQHNEGIKLLQKMAKTCVKPNVMKNEIKLRYIWKNFKPKISLKKIENQGWIDIGFQVSNPVTDFRDSGTLGLYNLFMLSSKKIGKQLFLVSQTQGFEYFFASVSIYLTVMALHLLKDNLIYFGCQSQDEDLSDLLSNLDEQVAALERFQSIYEDLFIKFNAFWVKCNDRSFMELNNNLKIFKFRIYSQLKQEIEN